MKEFYVSMSKEEVYERLMNEVELMEAGDRKRRSESKIIASMAEAVNHLKLDTYHNIQVNNENGFLNKGNIGENILLYFKRIQAETENFEVKVLAINTPHILVNENVKNLFVVVIKNTECNVYYTHNAQAYNEKRLTLTAIHNGDFQVHQTYTKRMGF